jgi:DNA mismatch repair protein MutL
VALQSASDSLPWTEGERVREPQQTYAALPGLEVRPFGQINETFLVAQVGTELHVVDQHTAHERVLFERLSRRWRERQVLSQPLLIPEQVELAPHQAVLLDRHLADLEPLGLAIERFGSATFLIRAVPADLQGIACRALLEDLLDDLSQWSALPSLEARIQPILASLACHAAVRSGRSMDLPEIKQLVEDWAHAGSPTTCPHGRRIALRLSVDELSRIFGRA